MFSQRNYNINGDVIIISKDVFTEQCMLISLTNNCKENITSYHVIMNFLKNIL